ncbi:MAG: hypothetical protein AAF485_06210 [Chloroflexota bacterium]
MTKDSNFQEAFSGLKEILDSFAPNLTCVTDEPHHFYLDTQHIMTNKKPLFFGAVQTRKSYVSYYLMPVYVFPELLETMSPELKQRMQGKSCFNFKKSDEALFAELADLTEAGYNRYKEAGYI